ncbi:hypothetical protein [Poriferisphaera sp. WC338]|uniref:hypothetical protein n=1 Tax=Poriferisphaera sp. WC338 TaxID=3425129 RepID=UPI003D81BE08
MSDVMKVLSGVRPRDEGELHLFVKRVLGLNVPREAMEEGSSSPFAYLVWAFFEGVLPASESVQQEIYDDDRRIVDHEADDTSKESVDAVVWANRGGGKTLLGAVATLMDMLFKPGIQVRILGGSLEQSGRMYEHLLGLLERPMLRGVVKGEPTQRKIEMVNGSRVEILSQSQRSVRGVRVHKLRCDEVEEFEKEIWEAAQLVTKSGWCGDVWVRGSIEAMSTMHRAGGLMSELLRQGREVFRWNAMDVIEKCEENRGCDTCCLQKDCAGRAKAASGFVRVDDLVSQWKRTSRGVWDSEMMCRGVKVSDLVYPQFKRDVHVREMVGGGTKLVIGGMDFGMRSPTVVVLAQVVEASNHEIGEEQKRVVYVVAEHVEGGKRLEEHAKKIGGMCEWHGLNRPKWLGVDPAGQARNLHTGESDVAMLRKMGYEIRAKRSGLREGIELVRKMMDHGELIIHPRCEQLIEGLERYHFDARHEGRQEPVKDGADHVCDALRYMLINMANERQGGGVVMGRYL